MPVGPLSGCRTVCLISLCVYLTPRPVMIGNSTRERRWSQNGQLVGNGKGTASKPNPPMAFAPRAQDPVRFGRVFHMQDHMDFGLVWGVGKHW
jgi:hypothetical protein